MNPDLSSWQELASIDSGDFAEIPYPVLLAALARQRRTLELEMTRKPIEKRIVFDGGAPVECRSNLAHETLGRYLVSIETISAEDFRTYLAESFSRGLPLGEVLLERSLLTPQTLYKSLQQNLARKLLDGFTWQHGEFRMIEVDGPATVEIRVNTAQLILTGIQKLSTPEEVSRAIEPMRGQTLAASPAPSPLGSFRLRGASQRLVETLADGPLAFPELVRRTGLETVESERALYALSLLGRVLPEERLSEVKVPAGASLEVAGERAQLSGPPGAGPSAEELLLLQSKVLEGFLCFRRRDSFDFLGVAEDADLEQIERAYLETAHTFAPWGAGYEALGEDQDKARALFLAAAEAYSELKDTERRGTVLFRRKVAREKQAREKTQLSDLTIQTDLLDPAVQYEKAQRMLADGDLKQAVEVFDFAADCDPQNPLYRAEAAHARHLLDPRLNSKQAIQELEEVLRNHTNHGLATYYLGSIHGELGNLEWAEEYLRRSIKLMAPDRRPIEALKELSSKRR